jgi:glycerophosphoryl diester phosphodiesterase
MQMKLTLKKVAKYLLVFLISVLIILHLLAKPAPQHPYFDQFDSYPLVIAHAGSKLYPTDTLFALQQYAEMGVDILEMDVNMSKDGQIVVIHDDTVDRTTNGTGKISEMTLVEIQALDAGYNWTNGTDESHPFRGIGINIPTLKEAFSTFPEYPMVVEIKQESPAMEEALCNLIREFDMESKVMVPSFSDVAMQNFREFCPEVATAASSGEVRDFVYRTFGLVAGTISPPYFALQVPESSDGIPVTTKLLIAFAKWRNVEVHIWTINDPADMQRFIDMGVDGIMTDRTDLLLEILNR